ncbi:hypothetical protein [Kitasatospora sp. MBT66]|uniref:hypothetical protein n=1 Tax=Kitasatospora sp. MBT66 TaxID=1444769 RepID=UPI001E30C189|nr:hypothetical protein [Kitasatospora sp. MBT66]
MDHKTTRKAIAHLRAAGLVVTRTGMGSFVTDRTPWPEAAFSRSPAGPGSGRSPQRRTDRTGPWRRR